MKVYKDAISGRFVSRAYAEANPATTYAQNVSVFRRAAIAIQSLLARRQRSL